MSITVERFVTGPIETNTYAVIDDDSRECLILDPSSGLDEVFTLIREEQFTPRAIIITHGHFDHIGGIPEIIAQYPSLPVYIHPDEKILLTDPMHNMSFMLGENFSYNGPIADLNEGPFTIGSFSGTVFVISGHSPAGCALLIGKYLLCGDIIFPGSIGRTDFPGGSERQLVDGIKKKLMALDDETVICPGHMGRTTIGRERRMNPFL
ncbi:MAG: MBL fold metallo-hydrolase [Chitinispirillaceae bacterium]|nr:MBL fold metallo-hydrolase [Chitinispirillaceae bacterium]